VRSPQEVFRDKIRSTPVTIDSERKNPDFRRDNVRLDGFENLEFYNTDCIEYCYDMVIHQLVALGIADNGAGSDEELVSRWLKRVITLDETLTLQRSD